VFVKRFFLGRQSNAPPKKIREGEWLYLVNASLNTGALRNAETAVNFNVNSPPPLKS
jgi:hypothetical protein